MEQELGEVMDVLHAYTLKIIELGRRALALQQQGKPLPEELAGLAAELQTLEAELRPKASASRETGRLADTSRPATDDILVVGAGEIDDDSPTAGAPGSAPSPLVIDVPPDSAGGVASPGGEPRACARCGAMLRPGKRFCHRCGAPVEALKVVLLPQAQADLDAIVDPL